MRTAKLSYEGLSSIKMERLPTRRHSAIQLQIIRRKSASMATNASLPTTLMRPSTTQKPTKQSFAARSSTPSTAQRFSVHIITIRAREGKTPWKTRTATTTLTWRSDLGLRNPKTKPLIRSRAAAASVTRTSFRSQKRKRSVWTIRSHHQIKLKVESFNFSYWCI